MKTISFECYKVSSKLSLIKIASFFEIKSPLAWEDFIMLDETNISSILKYCSTSKRVYIFSFGCITFVNFNSDEISCILQAIESITGKLDHSLFSKFHDSHIIKSLSNNRFELWVNKKEEVYADYDITPIVSTILAKSVALNRIESDVSGLLDESEGMIYKLNKGQLRVNAKRQISNALRIMRFELEILNSIRIFDRSDIIDERFGQREIYDALAAHYELHHRFSVLEKKMDEVRNITRSYSTLSYSNLEKRLLIFEILLLSLFPVSHIFHILLETHGFTKLFGHILK